jgi:hypothetical protein
MGDRILFDTRPLAIDYTEPNVKMIQLLLGKGANPNDMDGSQSVWACCLRSMYALTVKYESIFSPHVKHWFDIAKLLLLHGADPRVIVDTRRGHLSRQKIWGRARGITPSHISFTPSSEGIPDLTVLSLRT